MRTSTNGAWLAIGLFVILFVVGVVARSGDTAAIIVTVAITLIAVNALRSWHRAARPGGMPGWRPPMRNVTPADPRLGRPSGAREGNEIGSSPTVVVVEPEAALDGLEAKLQVLDRLRANGLVSEAEYEAKRARLIAEF
ncbi:MAG TPA: SHOCT domain-containing protein [Candidatus Limnocylindrales bacterium]|nr:SHOCT domain-containing protein [Candidatus Limnocylindrales bacterium]